MQRRRLLWLWAGGLGFLGVVAVGSMLWAGALGKPPQTVLTIPKGTQASVNAGRGLEAIPKKIRLRAGDLFILRNEDTAPHRVGGFYVRPGETLSYRFSRAGVFNYACTIHPDRYTIFEVDARPSPAVLWWTELGLLGILVLLSGLLLGGRSTRLGAGALATGSAVALMGLFLAINSSRKLEEQPALEKPRPPTVESPQIGERLYLRLCEVCHGTSGRGDGPLAFSLKPRPANLIEHVPEHSDRALFRFIHDGLPGTRMPPLGDTLTDEEIWHLVDYIKTIGRKSGTVSPR